MSTPRVFATVTPDGQLVLPEAVRGRRDWRPGARVAIEETSDGLIVRPAPISIDEVAGMLRHDGPPITLEQMDEAITAEVMARHARGRY